MDDLLRQHKAERKALRKECNERLQGLKGAERSSMESLNKEKTDALLEKHKLELSGVAEEPEKVEKKSQVSKGQRRRLKQQEEELERLKRAEAIKAGAGPSKGQVELEYIEKRIKPMGLELKPMEADGHCLYRAVADQLDKFGESSEPHLLLRSICATYMRAHPHLFEGFMVDDLSFDDYCNRIRDTADWGGQLELRALACALETPIKVVSAETEPVIMGEEYRGEPIVVTFHQHYLSLGEHYNSVKKSS
mmetsp:Transcript_2759/g.3945  ORF Transcript_2759/g.3945 Transcript_2759/m.3945 type:complete len:250 (-) Transcript_2759:1278-2027(-)